MSNKHLIWGKKIPFNRPDSKLSEMKIIAEEITKYRPLKFALAISHYWGNNYWMGKGTIDTHTYLTSIKPGIVKSTFEDEPYLLSYIVEGSDRAVIAVPGGGYAFTQISDTKEPDVKTEGGKIADYLNNNGISCFVLSYRYNPYKMPVPLLDMQRAVRYLRCHAEQFGFSADKIDLIGFSAGGYQVGGFINLVQGKSLFPENYSPDETDKVDDQINTAAMFFPLLRFNDNQRGLYCGFSQEDIKNKRRRHEILDTYDLKKHITSENTPQFISHGTKDMLVKLSSVTGYVEAMNKKSLKLTYVEVPGANHGFIAHKEYEYVLDEYLDWLKSN